MGLFAHVVHSDSQRHIYHVDYNDHGTARTWKEAITIAKTRPCILANHPANR